MDGPTLQDRVSRGMGVAARRIGIPYVVSRPRGTANPLAARNRVIKLCAAFEPGSNGGRAIPGYGGLLWHGIFDNSYTRAGDYLASCDATYFVAAQLPLVPVQCVLTNRVIDILRPMSPVDGAYSGMVAETAEIVLAAWPACVQALHAGTKASPPDSRFGSWAVLLPALPADPQVADTMTDDLGRTFATAAAEETELGWRLIVRQIAG
jgi:hypothetical protein